MLNLHISSAFFLFSHKKQVVEENKHLNIVSFDIPYPPNYGGIIDVFYKIKALHKLGIKIHLHCFKYQSSPNETLNKYCETVTYYNRTRSIKHQLSKIPFIVQSRKNKSLLQNLCNNNFPILFEGLHTCGFLNDPRLKNRIKFVRTHNIEHHYYNHLAEGHTPIWKKVFYKTEAKKLQRFEQKLSGANKLFCITTTDTQHFNTLHNKAKYLPAFCGMTDIRSKFGIGDYLLFHGNLSVEENIEAVNYILTEIHPHHNFNFVVAGKNPSEKLQMQLRQTKRCILHKNPEQLKMDELIANAQIILLPTFQETGIKLKLLQSLSNGRFCLVNNSMINNTGVGNICHIANTPQEWITTIKQLMQTEFTKAHIQQRKNTVFQQFNDLENAKIIIENL